MRFNINVNAKIVVVHKHVHKHRPCRPLRARTLVVTGYVINTGPSKPTTRAEESLFTMATRVNLVGQILILTLSAKTDPAPGAPNGYPAPLDGTAQWTTNAPEVVALEPSADGLTLKVTPLLPGPFQIGVRADADLDADEERILEATFDGEVFAGEAASLGLSASVQDV